MNTRVICLRINIYKPSKHSEFLCYVSSNRLSASIGTSPLEYEGHWLEYQHINILNTDDYYDMFLVIVDLPVLATHPINMRVSKKLQGYVSLSKDNPRKCN